MQPCVWVSVAQWQHVQLWCMLPLGIKPPQPQGALCNHGCAVLLLELWGFDSQWQRVHVATVAVSLTPSSTLLREEVSAL